MTNMPPPRGATLTGPELAQLRRGALTLEHLEHDVHRGVDAATLARRIGEVRESLLFIIDRAVERGTLH